ncbi:MAG: DUF2207 domain-containing protein, partial [Actinomycetota bacterium]|nr:DUF2207 domain-containing protein [Actinomycetota bacterium]
MKRRALVLLVIAILMAAPATAVAKSYWVSEVRIDAAVAADGSMAVTEARTFGFEGAYTFVFWDLDASAASAIEILGVDGPTGPYTQTTDPGSVDSRPPGMFYVNNYGSGVEVRVYHRTSDDSATFSLRYRVIGAAKKWDDTSELYWKFIGDGWDVASSNVSLKVTLPNVTKGDVQVWTHGPLTGFDQINEDGSISAEVDSLPAGVFMEQRVLFPRESL